MGKIKSKMKFMGLPAVTGTCPQCEEVYKSKIALMSGVILEPPEKRVKCLEGVSKKKYLIP